MVNKNSLLFALKQHMGKEE